MQNNKDLTEKYGRNIRVQHFEEGVEEVVAEKLSNIRTRAKQKEHDYVTKEVANSQLKKDTFIGDGQKKEREEEPRYSDRSVKFNITNHSNYNENKTENHDVKKVQKDIKSENFMKWDKYVETGLQCGYCKRWFHFKYEETTKEKLMQVFSEEMQYFCKKARVN